MKERLDSAGATTPDEPLIPAPRSHPEAGPVASAEWQLESDRIRWSDEMYALFDRDPSLGPLRLEDVPAQLVPADRAACVELIRGLCGEVRSVEGEFRILRSDGRVRTVHLVGEQVRGPGGRARSAWVLVRDVSMLRETQQALLETREQLMAQRQLARAEHRIAAELQRVVMPWWHRPVALPGLDVATRYFPAEALARVGGDWYDGLTLPDGSVLFALGDMSGHGLTAASGMTTLRGALEGIAMTGASPGSILYWLNRLMVHTLSDEAVASVVCCRFDPLSRVLTWAQAGHPTPLLFREGTGVLLDPPEGVLLGADREPVFGESRVELRPGDVMLMYTDGLVERRGQDVDASVQPLLDLAPRLRGADARTCVDLVVSRLGHTDYEDDACVMAVRVTGG